MRVFDTDSPSDVAELMQRQSFKAPQVLPRPLKIAFGTNGAIAQGLTPIQYEDSGLDILLPQDQWVDKTDEAHELESMPMYHMHDSWRPHGTRYNQDGLGYCVDAETEILTENGFVKFPEYDGKSKVATVNQETGVLEYQMPSKLHCYDWDGEVIRSKHRRVDFAVTPKHRMYVRKWSEKHRTLSSDYSVVNAEDMGWYCGLMHAPKPAVGTDLVEVEVPGDRAYDGDDYVAMLALIVSDGYAGNHRNRKTKNLVSFCCFDEQRYESVKALAERCGFSEQPSRKGVFSRWDAGCLAKHVREECYRGGLGALNKIVPRIIKCASERQIKLFLTWFGDQDHKRPLHVYFTSSQSLADDLQELLFRAGKRSTPVWRDGRTATMKNGQEVSSNRSCTLVVSQTDRLCIERKNHLYREHYKGKVYCVTVPNSTMVTRRNGTTLISSQCWTWSGTGCLMTTRAIESKDLVLLAPVSMGYLVGWANRGNYLASFIKGAREDGICPVTDTESFNSTNRSASYWGQFSEQRKLYKLDKVWDLNPRNIVQECISSLCYCRSIYIAYNWWGHALELVGIRYNKQKRQWEWIISNSHNEPEPIILTGSRAEPDEAIVFVSSLLTY